MNRCVPVEAVRALQISRDRHRAALADLLSQLEGIGITIYGEDEGQWAGTEGLSFIRAYTVLDDF